MPDQLVDDPPVGLDPIGQGVADDLHHPFVHFVDRGRLGDQTGLQTLDIEALRRGKGVEDVGGEIGMGLDQLVLDDDDGLIG